MGTCHALIPLLVESIIRQTSILRTPLLELCYLYFMHVKNFKHLQTGVRWFGTEPQLYVLEQSYNGSFEEATTTVPVPGCLTAGKTTV